MPALVPDVEVVGDPVRRLPGTVTFSCLYVDGETLLPNWTVPVSPVSSGSSCTSSTLMPSHVLKAMGVLSEGNVRVSLPPGTPPEDVERFLEVPPGTVARCGRGLGAPVATEAVPETGGDLVVDAIGRRCPIPVIELAKVIGDVARPGARCVSCPTTRRPAWTSRRGARCGGRSSWARSRRRRERLYLVRRST